VCVNGYGVNARHSNEAYKLINDSGKWAQRALADIRKNVSKDIPINWSQFIHTHNSYNNNADGYPDPNHWFSISDQLDLGSRWLDLDLHPVGNFLKLCHAQDNGAGCTLTDRFYSSAIKEIATWLNKAENKDEILIIQLEDKASDAASVVNPISGYLGDKVYGPNDFRTVLRNCPGCWNATEQPRWPTPREMLAAGKRVIIIGDNSHGDNADMKTWTFTGKFDRAVDAVDFTSDCGNGELPQANSRNWGMIGEDRTIGASLGSLGTIFGKDDTWRGLVDPAMAGQAVGCGATKLGYDMLGGTQHTDGDVCRGGPRNHLVGVNACATGDKRIDNSVWSWKQNEPATTGNRALYETATRRWLARPGSEASICVWHANHRSIDAVPRSCWLRTAGQRGGRHLGGGRRDLRRGGQDRLRGADQCRREQTRGRCPAVGRCERQHGRLVAQLRQHRQRRHVADQAGNPREHRHAAN
jgi:hypothetical protein